MAHHYLLCGWHLCSDLPIPELLRWPEEAASAAADITLTEGEVPETLPNGATIVEGVATSAEGSLLIVQAGLLRFLICDGNRVRMQILSETGRQSWRLYFLGTVLSCLCLQRGVFPLHAASLRVGKKIVAIAGHSGDGKSTLAMELMRRGHDLLSDDLTAVQMAGGVVTVVPAFPRLKLWRQSLEAAGVSDAGLPRVRPDVEKFDLQPSASFDAAPAPLGAIVVLDTGGEIVLERPSRFEIVPLLHAFVSRPKYAKAMGRSPEMLNIIGKIAAQVPVYILKRPKRFECLAETAAAIETLGA